MNTKILAEKKKYVEDITALFDKSQATVIVEYRGMKVSDLQLLRRELAKEEAEIHIFKNTMVTRALTNKGVTLDAPLEGPNAFVFSYRDPVGAPKVISKFAKSNPLLVIKGGVMDGRPMDKAEVMKLATLPNKEGLLSMLLSCLNEPIRKFAATIAEIKN